MPELPEMEAWRRQLSTSPCRAFPIVKAGPAHVATLKTFDPPLSALEGPALRGRERRGKRLLFPTDDGELVLLVHLMTAGRLRTCGRREGRRRRRRSGSSSRAARSSCSRRRARRSAPASGCSRPSRPRRSSRTSGRRRSGSARSASARSSRDESRRLHALLRDQRADRRHRPRLGERDPPHARSSRRSRSRRELDDEEVRGSRTRSTRSSRAGSSCASAAPTTRRRTASTDRLGEPCHVCGTPIAQVDYEEHTIYYCPNCQTGGRVLKDRRLSRLLR